MIERAQRPAYCRSRGFRPVHGPSACRAGFTLVELMVVVAIIIALTAIVVPSYQAMSANGERNSCAANLKAIGQALALFREDYQCFPPDSTEYLWTQDAVRAYRERYGSDPPGDYSEGTLIGAAYAPDGSRINTGIRGRGLYTLYYLGAYSSVLPPLSLEPQADPERISADLRLSLAASGKGLNGLLWYRSGGYVTKLGAFHCPANQAKLNELILGTNEVYQRAGIPTLGGWNNYDLYYRRNFWNPAQLPVAGVTDDRHLCQPYPPADTVVTWCPHHRTARAPSGPGAAGPVNPGDKDLVLFADGSVRRMASRADNRMFAEPPGDAGWPAGPIM